MLTRVTITGADDAVDPHDLMRLSDRYSFVEWGLLMSESRAGTPRYPSRKWLMQLETLAEWFPRRADPPHACPMQLSAHFCGEIARQAMSNRLHPFPVIERVQRIQINGWAEDSAGLVAFGRAMPCYEIILQVRHDGDMADAAREACAMPRGSILYDPSGGRGERTDHRLWPLGAGRRQTVRVGYAGGIGPDNLEQIAEDTIRSHDESGTDDFWLDMESGVRTDDRFDFGKVRQVLEKASRFIRPGGAA